MSDINNVKAPVRHRLTTRIWHIINAICLFILLGSGLSIFNAHPRLYWGNDGANSDYAWLAVSSTETKGFFRVGGAQIETTGVIGHWVNSDGETKRWAFPGWATIPSFYSLADGRKWHFFFGWIFSIGLTLFMIRSLWNRHIQRDLRVRREEWRPSYIWQSLRDHMKLSKIRASVEHDYNIIQKLSYIGVIFILLPLVILTGLTMSPAMDANWEFLSQMFFGRQSARSIHFICAALLVAFFIVHIVMVILSGPITQLKAIIFGGEKREHGQ